MPNVKKNVHLILPFQRYKTIFYTNIAHKNSIDMQIQDGDQMVRSHKVANIMNVYFVNIASTIREPVYEEAQLRTDHKFCECANENHTASQSIIASLHNVLSMKTYMVSL